MDNPNYDADFARVCHEANRVLQKANGEPVNLAWDWCNEALQNSAVEGVRAALKGATPEELHESWCNYKEAEGWTYGPEKSADKRTHPCLVPYSQLPVLQRRKDMVFMSIVQLLDSAVTPPLSEEPDESSDTAPAA